MTWWRDAGQLATKLAATGWNATVLSEQEGCDRSTIVKWMGRLGVQRPSEIDPKQNHRAAPPQPPPLVPIEEAEVRLTGDAGLSSDWHLPVTRWDVFHRWLDDCRDHGIKQGICAGDMFNFDRWSRHEEPQKGTSPCDDLDAGVYAVREALKVFDHLYVSRGNHDDNMARKLDFGVKFDRVMRMALAGLTPDELARITVTGRDYVIVDTPEGEYRVCHTRTYSRMPLAYPNRIALRHGQHVAGGHRHHHAQGYAANGKRLIELGGFMDEDRMAYTKRYTNDFPMMQCGYALLIDGKVRCPMLAD